MVVEVRSPLDSGICFLCLCSLLGRVLCFCALLGIDSRYELLGNCMITRYDFLVSCLSLADSHLPFSLTSARRGGGFADPDRPPVF